MTIDSDIRPDEQGKWHERGFHATTNHPWWVLLFLLTITGVSLVGYYRPDLVADLFRQVEEEPPPGSSAVQRPRRNRPRPDVEPLPLTGAEVVLVVQSDAFFTPEGSEAVRDVVRALRENPVVASLFWLDDAPPLNIFALNGSVFPKPSASQRQFDSARERSLRNPLIGGQLLSDDAETLLLMLRVEWLFVEGDEQLIESIRETAEKTAAKHDGVEMSFLITGSVPNYLTFRKRAADNETRFQIIGYGMILLMAMILFRGLRAVLIVASAPVLGIFWTKGFLYFFELESNPFNEVVLPILIALVGFTDGVHLMIEIRRRRAAGTPIREAAGAAVAKVGLACFLTSLTTAIGLGSLAFAHHEAVRDFGWSCVVGVILTFLAVVLLIPLLCRTPLAGRVHEGHGRGLVDRNLGRVSVLIDAVLARRRFFAWAGVLITLGLTGVSATLRPDERVSNALPPRSEAARAVAHLDEAMNGMEPGRVDIIWNEQIADDSPEILEVVTKIDDVLRAEPLIGHPVSLRSFVDVLPGGDGDASERMSRIELMPGPLRRSFYVPENYSARINFRVQDLGIAAYGPTFERVQQRLGEILEEHPNFDAELNGSAVWRWENLYQIMVDLALSLGSASLIIFIVLTIAYRSLRIGLIALVPNFFPLVLTASYLVLSGQSLELASVCAFTVCLGIAVDDTIHFLTRYREEDDRQSEEDRIRIAFTGTGTALIMTTIVLVAGFSTVLLSELREQRIFATMAGLTIGSALLGDLLFLPAMLAHFRPRSANDESDPKPEQV